MLNLTQAPRTGEFLLSVGNAGISMEIVTLAAGPALKSGQLLGIVTATSEYAAYSNAAADGTEVAAAVLYAPQPERVAATKAAAVARLAEVHGEQLVGLDAPARADLAARFIIVR
ncbi:MAG: head decoration protein [Pseudogulbenkiania sp.]|nr:head decoration protein [Pseudogulbenkiania sp.]